MKRKHILLLTVKLLKEAGTPVRKLLGEWFIRKKNPANKIIHILDLYTREPHTLWQQENLQPRFLFSAPPYPYATLRKSLAQADRNYRLESE